MKNFIRTIIKELVKQKFFLKILVLALKELSKLTTNTLDDQFVKTIEARINFKK